MLIFINKNIPTEAKNKLSGYGEIIEINSEGLVEKYLSGHPDLFLSIVDDRIIYSPSLPEGILAKLKTHKVNLVPGNSYLKSNYPGCAAYNAVITKKFVIHKKDITDTAIIESCAAREFISVNQGMTRCSLIALNDSAFITSDAGILQKLETQEFDALKVTTKQIILPGKEYGLFGGTCGIINSRLFLIGNLDHYDDNKKVREFCSRHSVEIIELYDGPLFDGGSILFYDNQS